MNPVWHLQIRPLRDDEKPPPELADTHPSKLRRWTAYAIDGLVIAGGCARSPQYMDRLRQLLAPASYGPHPPRDGASFDPFTT